MGASEKLAFEVYKGPEDGEIVLLTPDLWTAYHVIRPEPVQCPTFDDHAVDEAMRCLVYRPSLQNRQLIFLGYD